MSRLVFEDGSPVRAASALDRLGDGGLVAQDDANFAAWQRNGSITPLRIFPPVEGRDHFSEADGTKHLKADLEARWGSPGVREPRHSRAQT
ncbi:MAG: hypothetical protein ACKV2O_14200 [Acidimicrobiales bacterium]